MYTFVHVTAMEKRKEGTCILPNVAVDLVALLFRVREVLGSNLGLKTANPD
jgi:hypothetical protein